VEKRPATPIQKKKNRLIFLALLVLVLFFPNYAFSSHVIATYKPKQSVERYIQTFYNRYSKHFDQYGLVYKMPEYGVTTFKTAETPRERMSLALYYKYRAISGDAKARRIIRDAILESDFNLEERPLFTQSFEDAAAQFLMVRALEQIPSLLSPTAEKMILQHLEKRAKKGILANDTSNRAALSGVYWQHIINALFQRGIIDGTKKTELSELIENKIKKVLTHDITSNGWYLEGEPMKFNPHYHIVTAAALMRYAEMTNDSNVRGIAERMADNIRMLAFKNGMIEAGIGERPVGLGAQAYLGVAFLSYAISQDDLGVFLSYASEKRFFSDAAYPNRLEYHNTQTGKAANFHDDMAFSNMAELVKDDLTTQNTTFINTDKINSGTVYYKDDSLTLINLGNSLWINDLSIIPLPSGDTTSISQRNKPIRETIFINGATARNLQDSDRDGIDDDEENLRMTNPWNADTDRDGKEDGQEITQGTNPRSKINIQSTVERERRYGKVRLSDPLQEKSEADHLHEELEKAFSGQRFPVAGSSYLRMVNAYIYGRYTVDEIVDEITYKSGTVHPSIKASEWRTSRDYRKYLERLR
jgi:hypothetical protein